MRQRRRDMFEEALCVACDEPYDREIGTDQELCILCLRESFDSRNNNYTNISNEKRKDLENLLKIGPTLNVINTDNDREIFLRRLSAIRRIRGIPEVEWEFTLGYEEVDEIYQAPMVDVQKILRQRRKCLI